MKYPRILSALRSAKWAVTPSTLHAITETLGAHLRGNVLRVAISDKANALTSSPMSGGGVAVIPIKGIIGKGLSQLETECGGCDVEAVGASIDEALASAAIDAVVLDIDSPGGVVSGVPELARKIQNASKPIYAFTSGQCCSAAYWIAACCDGIFCTMSADVGSIGVYVALVDDSEWWKKEGYKLELIKAGEYKAMGISGKPLEPAERAMIQADVDAIYAMFTGCVKAGRDGVSTETMQGQTFMGANAVTANLVDELVEDINEVLAFVMQQRTASLH